MSQQKDIFKDLGWPENTNFDDIRAKLVEYLNSGQDAELLKIDNKILSALLVAKKEIGAVATASDVDSKAYLASVRALNRYKTRLEVYRLVQSAILQTGDAIPNTNQRFNDLDAKLQGMQTTSTAPAAVELATQALRKKADDQKALKDAAKKQKAEDEKRIKDAEEKARQDAEMRRLQKEAEEAAAQRDAQARQDARAKALRDAKTRASVAVEATTKALSRSKAVISQQEYEEEISRIYDQEAVAYGAGDANYKLQVVDLNVIVQGFIYVYKKMIPVLDSVTKKQAQSSLEEFRNFGRLTLEDITGSPPTKLDRMVELFSYQAAFYDSMVKRINSLSEVVQNYSVLLSNADPDNFPGANKEFIAAAKLEEKKSDPKEDLTNSSFADLQNMLRSNTVNNLYTLEEMDAILAAMRALFGQMSRAKYVNLIRSDVSEDRMNERRAAFEARKKLNPQSARWDQVFVSLEARAESIRNKVVDVDESDTKSVESLFAPHRSFLVALKSFDKGYQRSQGLAGDLKTLASNLSAPLVSDAAKDDFQDLKDKIVAEAERLATSRPGDMFGTDGLDVVMTEELEFLTANVAKTANEIKTLLTSAKLQVRSLLTSDDLAAGLLVLADANLKLNVAVLQHSEVQRRLMQASDTQYAVSNVLPGMADVQKSIAPLPLPLTSELAVEIGIVNFANALGIADYAAEFQNARKASIAVSKGAAKPQIDANRLAVAQASYVRMEYTKPGPLGAKMMIKTIKQNIKSWQKKGEVVPKEALEAINLGKELTLCNNLAKKDVESMRTAYIRWSVTFPEFKRLADGLRQRRRKDSEAPSGDIKNMVIDVGVAIKKLGEKYSSTMSRAAANGIAITNNAVLAIKGEVSKNQLQVAEELASAAEEDLVEAEKACEADAKASEGALGADAEVALDILERQGTRWTGLPMDAVVANAYKGDPPLSDQAILKALYDFIPKLSKGYLCNGWARGLLRAADRDLIDRYRIASKALDKMHKDLFPSRTAYSKASRARIDQVVNQVHDAWLVYDSSLTLLQGGLDFRIRRRFDEALQLIVASKKPSEVFTAIFGSGEVIFKLFGAEASTILERMKGVSKTMFRQTTDPDEEGALGQVFMDTQSSLKNYTPLNTDFGMATVNEVIQALADLGEGVALAKAAEQARAEPEAQQERLANATTEVGNVGDASDLSLVIHKLQDKVAQQSDKLSADQKKLLQKAEEICDQIDVDGIETVDAALGRSSIQVIAGLNAIVDQIDTARMDAEDINEDLWIQNLGLTEEEYMEQMMAGVLNFPLEEYEIETPAIRRDVQPEDLINFELRVGASISSSDRGTRVQEAAVAQNISKLFKAIYGVKQDSLALCMLSQVQGSVRRQRAFRALVGYRSDRTAVKLSLRYLLSRRMSDEVKRSSTLALIARDLDDVLKSIATIIEQLSNGLVVQDYVPAVGDMKMFANAMKTISSTATVVPEDVKNRIKALPARVDLAIRPSVEAAARATLNAYSLSGIKPADLDKTLQRIETLAKVAVSSSDRVKKASMLLVAVDYYDMVATFTIGKAYVAGSADKNNALFKTCMTAREKMLEQSTLVSLLRDQGSTYAADLEGAELLLRANIETVLANLKAVNDAKVVIPRGLLGSAFAYTGVISAGTPIKIEQINAALDGLAESLFDSLEKARTSATARFDTIAKTSAAAPAPAVTSLPVVAVVDKTQLGVEIKALGDLIVKLEANAIDVDGRAAGAYPKESAALQDLLRDARSDRDDAQTLFDDPTADAVNVAQRTRELQDLVTRLQNGFTSALAIYEAALVIGARAAADAAAAAATAKALEKATKAQRIAELTKIVEESEEEIKGYKQKAQILEDSAINESLSLLDESIALNSAIDGAVTLLANAKKILAKPKDTLTQGVLDEIKALQQARSKSQIEMLAKYNEFQTALDNSRIFLRAANLDAERKSLQSLYDATSKILETKRARFKGLISGRITTPEFTAAKDGVAGALEALENAKKALDDPASDAKTLALINTEWDLVGSGSLVAQLDGLLDALEKVTPSGAVTPRGRTASMTGAAPVPAPITPGATPQASASGPAATASMPASTGSSAAPIPRTQSVEVAAPFVPAASGASSSAIVPAIGAAGTVAALPKATEDEEKALYSARDLLSSRTGKKPITGILDDVTRLTDNDKILRSIALLKPKDIDTSTEKGYYRSIFLWSGITKSSQGIVVLFVPKSEYPDADEFTVVNSDADVPRQDDALTRSTTRILVSYDVALAASDVKANKPNTSRAGSGVKAVKPNTIPLKSGNDAFNPLFLVVAYTPVKSSVNPKAKTVVFVPESGLAEVFTFIGRKLFGAFASGKFDASKRYPIGPKALKDALYQVNEATNTSINLTTAGVISKDLIRAIEAIKPADDVEELIYSFKDAVDFQNKITPILMQSLTGSASAKDEKLQNQFKTTLASYAAEVMYKARMDIDKRKNDELKDGSNAAKRLAAKHLMEPLKVGSPINESKPAASAAGADDSDWGFSEGEGQDAAASAPIQAAMPASRQEHPADPNELPSHWQWS